MAKVKKTKNPRTMAFILITPFLLIISLLAFNLFNSMGISTGTTVVGERKDNDYYLLRADATEYQKQLYEELSAAINTEYTPEEEIARLVVNNYIADFYTWTNKKGNYDVGGLEYIYGGQYVNFYLAAKNQFYNYVTHYISEYGAENLLEVNSISSKAAYAPELMEYEGKTFTTFYVEASWTYKENDVFDSEEYQKNGYFYVIKNESGRYEIIDYYY